MTTIKPNPTLNNKPRKRRRRLKKSFIILCVVFVLALSLLLLFALYPTTSRKLKKMGYSPEAIEIIKTDKIANYLLDNNYYSANLESHILDGTYDFAYIDLYLLQETTTSSDINLYNRLTDKGYGRNEKLLLFSSLEEKEIVPLLVYDYVDTVEFYISDVASHRISNKTNGTFNLTGTYITQYAETEPSTSVDKNALIVNKHYYIDRDFTPNNLVLLSTQYAASDRYLAEEAADALKAMCDALEAETGLRMYASSAYRDYDTQETLYNGYVASMGQEQADTIAARPGFSEHQTGLTVDMTPVGSSMSEFGETEQYKWMLENCYKYGWILRYPEGKESITGYAAEPWHYRYLGVDLATKVYKSGYTYEEYYELYLK